MKKKLIVAIILSISIFMMVAGIAKINEYKEVRTFTKEKWLKQPDNRHLIVKDLIKKQNLYGMSKVEISNLLGQPSPELSGIIRRLDSKEWKVEEFSDTVYYLLDPPGYPEGRALYIGFDEQDKVADYSLIAYGT